ncbi:MAG: methionine--tRNA ligase subunit beta [Phycisphaerae bacterium]|nr:methionine--tRNA ligase subunit beta [Phycisphaerae bacterium]
MSDAPAKPVITFDDFAKLDLRIARVVECVPHPNADKLLVLKIDIGGEQRQIVAGIRAYYDPATLVGRNIVVVANLAPRTMRGQESQGMLLAASTPDRSRVVILAPIEEMPAGSPVS